MTHPAGAENLEAITGRIESIDALGGGSIHRVYRCVAGGERYFVKYAAHGSKAVLSAETASLELLQGAGSGLKIPSVIGMADGPDGSWLVLEWLERSRMEGYPVALARGLAKLHHPIARPWGWNKDGFIGTLRQSNRSHSRWWEFWWEERLLPQILLGGSEFDGPVWRQALPAALEECLGPVDQEGASLLHGDLWSGNVMSTDEGPAVFDPSSYYGHREVDIAMAELFGGFDSSFFSAYDEALPLQGGHERRRAAYQLYYLLVHVNLFGQAYSERARNALGRVLAPR